MAFAAFLALSSQAQAQTLTTFVSNTGQTSNGTLIVGSNSSFTFTQAQQFTAGDNEGGYTLSEVVAKLADVGDDSMPRVSIYSDASGAPGTSLYVLTNPASVSGGSNIFTAPANAVLAKEEKYWVVFENTATGTATSDQYKVRRESTGDEDAGGASGWSIRDSHHFKNQTSGPWTSHATVILIAIKGTLGGTTVSTDATLSGLALKNAADDSAITLSPSTFVSTTTSYTADVANDVDEITVLPTVNESNATYEIQDGDGTALVDADSATGFQVALSEGENTVKVEVTAEDGNTTETYTVVVTRLRRVTTTPAAPPEIAVPNDWSLIPTGLGAGDKFRLLFLSSTKTDGESYDIQGNRI